MLIFMVISASTMINSKGSLLCLYPILTGNSSDKPDQTTTLLFVLMNRTGLDVARHDTELAIKSITVAVLSRAGKVGVWHSMALNWQVILSRWLYSLGSHTDYLFYDDIENKIKYF